MYLSHLNNSHRSKISDSKGQPGTAAEFQMFGFENRFKRNIRKQHQKQPDRTGSPEKTLGILVRKLLTVRIGMPFFSSCIRAITSSICATGGEKSRKRKSCCENLPQDQRRFQSGSNPPANLQRLRSAAATQPKAALTHRRTHMQARSLRPPGGRLRGPAAAPGQPRFPAPTEGRTADSRSGKSSRSTPERRGNLHYLFEATLQRFL